MASLLRVLIAVGLLGPLLLYPDSVISLAVAVLLIWWSKVGTEQVRTPCTRSTTLAHTGSPTALTLKCAGISGLARRSTT